MAFDIPNIFKGIGNWFGGGGGAATPTASTTPTPQAGAAATPSAAPAASTDLSDLASQLTQDKGGLTGFLDNPLVQGALATYLGAIGSPRAHGLGGAISAGGLAGLKQYESARKEELEPYLLGAQIQKMGADTKQALASAGLSGARQATLEGIGRGNHQKAEGLRSQAKDLAQSNPQLAQTYTNIANSIDWDTSKPWSVDDLIAKPTEAIKNIAQAQESHQKELQSKVETEEVLPATALKERAQAGQASEEGYLASVRANQEVPAQALKDRAEAAAARVRAATNAEERDRYRAEAEKTFGEVFDSQSGFPAWEKVRSDDYQTKRAAFIESEMSKSEQSAQGLTEEQPQPTQRAAPAVTTVPKLPKGGRYAVRGDEHGYVDKGGEFHAFPNQ